MDVLAELVVQEPCLWLDYISTVHFSQLQCITQWETSHFIYWLVAFWWGDWLAHWWTMTYVLNILQGQGALQSKLLKVHMMPMLEFMTKVWVNYALLNVEDALGEFWSSGHWFGKWRTYKTPSLWSGYTWTILSCITLLYVDIALEKALEISQRTWRRTLTTVGAPSVVRQLCWLPVLHTHKWSKVICSVLHCIACLYWKMFASWCDVNVRLQCSRISIFLLKLYDVSVTGTAKLMLWKCPCCGLWVSCRVYFSVWVCVCMGHSVSHLVRSPCLPLLVLFFFLSKQAIRCVTGPSYLE